MKVRERSDSPLLQLERKLQLAEARLAEEKDRELRRARTIVNTFWENSSDLLATVDRYGNLVNANPAFVRAFGEPSGNLSARVCGDTCSAVSRALDDSRSDVVSRCKSASGAEVVVCWSFTPLLDDGTRFITGRLCRSRRVGYLSDCMQDCSACLELKVL